MKKRLWPFILVLLVSVVSAGEISERYFEGMQAFDRKEYKKSIRIFKKILKGKPGVTDLGRVQAKIGNAYEALGKYKKAFKAYEKVFEHYSDYAHLDELAEREFRIAERFASGEGDKLLGIDFSESDKTALEIFDRVIHNFPFGPYADRALLRIIEILIDKKKHEQAETRIDRFKKAYENSQLLDDVFFLDGMNYYEQTKRPAYNQTYTNKAVEKLKKYLERFPAGRHRDEAQNHLAKLHEILGEKKFKTAEYYLEKGNRGAAEKYFKEVIENFPETSWAKQASRRLSM
jgi:tetratricopeptide (TPR) repeat protein